MKVAEWTDIKTFIFFLGVGIFMSCSEKQKEDPLFVLLPPEKTGVDFANILRENDSINLLDYEYVYNGGGVAVADINNDELPDLFFSGNMVPSRLYLNKGGLKFQDITGSAGISAKNWATGVAVGDVNADGYPDLYVCSAGNVAPEERANLLYINNGDNTFTESAAAYGVDDTGFSTMAAFLDYDLDSDLDLYVLTYANDTWNTNVVYPKVTDGTGKATDRLYRNNGDGTFTNVSYDAGIRVEGYGLGVSVCDLNQDGWPDLYVSNDYIDDDFLYINNQNGSFTESAARYLNHVSHFAMGNDVADFNNDAYPDIMVVDMLPEDYMRQKLFSMTKNYEKFATTLKMGYLPAYMRNTLQLNNGNGSFSEIGQLSGVYQTDWSWAPLLADFDNDGFKDLFITNGYPKDIMNRDFLVYNKYANSFQAVRTVPSLDEQHRFKLQAINELQGTKIRNYLYRNNGDLTFANMSNDWGMRDPSYSNGAAFADLDLDGDLDLVVNNINDPAFVYENTTDQNGKVNYLRIRLEGDSLNRFALGAAVRLYAGGKGVQFLENSPYRGFQSTVEWVLHFGMGTSASADSVVVRWPNGQYSIVSNVKANQVITISQDLATSRSPSRGTRPTPLFQNVTSQTGIHYVHRDLDYNDFKIQPLLPHKLSQQGPGIAVGDVNGDGQSDIYVGGAQNSPGSLYIQSSDGTFSAKDFSQAPKTEDMGSLFFDADGDGDQDLYVVSGGNEQMPGVTYYRDHLYKNDGNGNFSLDPTALPEMFESGSCVTAADWDRDGDLDLFVGGRVHPGNYPLPGKTYLLQNNGGKFTDVTIDVGGKGFDRMGMVTCAVWTDFNNDRLPDLVVAGEWMPVTLFRNDGSRFTNVTRQAGLQNHTGWWNSILSGDFDQDGDTDYVVGNTGKNSPYKPTQAEPMSVFVKDFDQNGRKESLLTYFVEGKQQTVHSRDEITDQLSYMKKRFPRYESFARADFASVLTEEELHGAYVLNCSMFESIYLQNNGSGEFTSRFLPTEAQFAPLFGMAMVDGDGDGNPDLAAIGNSYATEVSTGRYDASFGCFLKGDGEGNFQALPFDQSGFFVKGDNKGLATLVNAKNENMILTSQNNGPLEVFAFTNRSTRIIRPEPLDAWAEIKLPGGRIRKQDLQYGSTYLSQSDRVLIVPDNAIEVRIISYSGEERVIGL